MSPIQSPIRMRDDAALKADAIYYGDLLVVGRPKHPATNPGFSPRN